MNQWFDDLPLLKGRISGKVTLSFLMLLLSTLLALIFKTGDRVSAFFAMSFSFLGDILLNRKGNSRTQPVYVFILGGISFMVAHLLYGFAYYTKIYQHNYSYINHGVAFALELLVFISIFIIFSTPKRSKLLAFGIIYLWVTGINYTTIFSYSISSHSIEVLALFGGLLFLASDVIIGCERFAGLKSKKARELVWWFYPLGQILIIIFA